MIERDHLKANLDEARSAIRGGGTLYVCSKIIKTDIFEHPATACPYCLTIEYDSPISTDDISRIVLNVN